MSDDQTRNDQHFSTPIFRTITTSKGRQALRLEAAFWDAIEDIASRSNRKPAAVARELLESDGAGDVNAARLIRSQIVRRLLTENKELRPITAPLALVTLMQLSPAPSFALDRKKRLVRVNEEFVRYLRAGLSRSGPVDGAQLTLERSTESIFEQAQVGVPFECGVSIRVQNYERKTDARIILPPPSPSPLLVGFLLR
ncbi:ribbon-helix-helix domain-containing protein [Devosia sp. SL43]|uniref:ribbon-helix-helix domain-containing protein n=1 Tax=Devosia sp. SL43 TaxID=2806348 RepID=UPI001F36A819|nr:ribbon-helix-helix domain-containing protein [Devosia sp. SL43]UJW83975.1 ribbon-helix-helix domain-containing protein [Devosia sp. SL43]